MQIIKPSSLVGLTVTLPKNSSVYTKQGNIYDNSGNSNTTKDITGVVSKVLMHSPHSSDVFIGYNLFQFANDNTHWYVVSQISNLNLNYTKIGDQNLLFENHGGKEYYPYMKVFDSFYKDNQAYIPAPDFCDLIGKTIKVNWSYQFIDFEDDVPRFNAFVLSGKSVKVLGVMVLPKFQVVHSSISYDGHGNFTFEGWNDQNLYTNATVLMLDSHSTYDLQPGKASEMNDESMDLPAFALAGDIFADDARN